MSDNPAFVSFDPRAPEPERLDALSVLQKGAMPGDGDLLPSDALEDIVAWVRDDLAEQSEMAKSLGSTEVPFPSRRAKSGERGMKSVHVDEWRVAVTGDYWERPGVFGADALRAMVDQTPVLNGVILTRSRQVQRFCRLAEGGDDNPGFAIRHADPKHSATASELEAMRLLGQFISNCGWERSPRRRKGLGRDSFAGYMAKLVRDSLTLDAAAIETEWKRDRDLGLDGLYAVDGATIRLCPESGYRGDPEVYAVQVVQGNVCSAYDFEDLIFEPRNPRTDVLAAGYGLPETEILVRVVTGFLNSLNLNLRGFTENAIPKGVLHLSGSYTNEDLVAFRRYWNALVKGLNSSWQVPVLVSKDQESKASFEKFGVDFDEMMFGKWMTFLVSIICAVYGMSPSEINFDSFSGGNTSPLAGSDTGEKLAASKDSGLRPLLAYFENLHTDYVVSEFSENLVFRWTGLDPADADKHHEMRKTVLTVNEIRAEEGYDMLEGPLGDAPVNTVLVGPWMQIAGLVGGEEDDAESGGEDETPTKSPRKSPTKSPRKAKAEKAEKAAPDAKLDGDGRVVLAKALPIYVLG